MLKTLNWPAKADDTPLLEIVTAALEATQRIPDETPCTPLPSSFDRKVLRALTIEQVDGGYVANIEFEVAPGEPNTIGTPEAQLLPTHRDAFLAGAGIVCAIATGSPELPFLVLDDQLVVVTVTPRGASFMMRRPFPTHCA